MTKPPAGRGLGASPSSLLCALCLVAGASAALAGSAPVAPAPVEDLAALIAAAGTADDHDGADLIAVFDRTETVVEPSGLAPVTSRRLLKALPAAGARRLGFQRFDYDPVTQLIEIRTVRIHRAAGGVTEVDPGTAADVTQPMHGIYWGARMRGLQLPRLAVGDAVELETYRMGFMLAYLAADAAAVDESRYIPPMRGHWYDVQLFAESYPMREKTVTVRTPRDKPLQFRTYNGTVHSETTYDDDHFTYRFWLADCPAAVTEWRTGDRQDYVPKVVMATVADWAAKSRWCWDVNQHQFDRTPEIDALVANLTRGLKTDEEKVHALNHWAAMNIRYCGLNMGEGEGYVLHPGDMILRERSGVCKDIAGMAITLCRAAGYEVYPAMTMAGARVERIPADQFNHCVGAWKKPDGTWHMLDPTWIPFGRYDWSRSEGEQHYVIGTPWGEDLASIRPYTPQENRVVLQVRGRIEPDGALVGRLAVEGDGEADTRLRRTLGQAVLAEREHGLRAWLANLAPGAVLVTWEAGDPQDWSRPMTLALEFRLPGYAAIGERACSWRPVAANLALAGYGGVVRLATPPRLGEERETPAMLWWPQEVTIDEEIELPKGFTPHLDGAVWTAGGAADLAACDLRADADGRAVRYHGTFRYDRREIPVEGWPALRAAVNTFQDAGEARLSARRKGA